MELTHHPQCTWLIAHRWPPWSGRIAQLVRAPGLHPEGHRFESCFAHPFDSRLTFLMIATRRWAGCINAYVVSRSVDSMQQQSGGILTQVRQYLRDVMRSSRWSGQGGMSTVYAARDLRFSGAVKLCAVKEMADLGGTSQERARVLELFEREANLLAELNHPAIPKVYDYFSENKRAYLVIEYIDGQNLESLIGQAHEPISESRVVSWAVQICEVLTYLHNHQPKPIIFRDMKPSNVMLTRDSRIMLIDFGIAKIFQSARKGTMIGTEGYAPPEQYRGLAEPRGDLYALGAMMHHLLTRADPRLEAPFTFHERMPRQLNPQVSPAVEEVVMKALSYAPEDRFANAVEMRDALLVAIEASSGATSLLPRRTSGTPMVAAPGAYMATRIEEAVTAAATTPTNGVSLSAGSQLRWRYSTGDEVRATPTVGRGFVLIGSYDNNFYALDVATGTMKWKVETGGGVVSRALIAGEQVVFGSEDNNVYAVRLADGQPVWMYATGGPVRSSPCLADGLIVIGSDDGGLFALDAQNGREAWAFRTWRPLRSSPVVVDGIAYVGSEDCYFYAVDVANGSSKWKYQTLRNITSSPAVAEGFVYVGSMDSHLYCFDAAAGWPVWKFKTGHFVVSSPAVHNGLVYVGSVDGFMYAVEVKTGKAAWRYKAGDQITSSPVVDNGRVYFGCVDKRLYCLDARNGSLLWTFEASAPLPGSPTVMGDALFFGSNDRDVYALRLL